MLLRSPSLWYFIMADQGNKYKLKLKIHNKESNGRFKQAKGKKFIKLKCKAIEISSLRSIRNEEKETQSEVPMENQIYQHADQSLRRRKKNRKDIK